MEYLDFCILLRLIQNAAANLIFRVRHFEYVLPYKTLPLAPCSQARQTQVAFLTFSALSVLSVVDLHL